MQPSQRKAGAVLSYLHIGLGSLISILYTPVMLRLLGQSEYGLYNLVASVVSYLGLLNFGFGSAYIRYYSRFKVKDDHQNIARLNGMFLIIFSVMGAIAVTAGMFLVANTAAILGDELTPRELSIARTLMAILVVNIAVSFPGIVFHSHVTAKEKFVFQKTIQIARVITTPFLVLPILIAGYGSIGMVVIMTTVNIGVEATNALYCYRKLRMRFCFREFDLSLMREMIVFSSFIFMNLVVNQINWNVDRFIIGRFHGTISVAVYSVAAQLNTYYLSLSTAISNVFIPRINQMVSTNNSNRELSSLFAQVGRLQFILLSLVFSGLIFFGLPFITTWAGAGYRESYPIALLLIIPVTIPLIQNLGIEIQRARNMHRFRSWVYLFIALGNIAITIPLVKYYGGIGAALGTALALVIGNIFIMNWYYHARVKLNMFFFWKQISRTFPGLIIPFIAGVLMVMYLDLFNFKQFLISGLLYVLVFACSMWLLGMNPYEKELVRKPLLRIRKKMAAKMTRR